MAAAETSARILAARPRVVLSRCLELEACRYDGGRIPSPVVRRLAPHVELVPACPEVGIGLGVPRAPIRLVRASPAAGGGPAPPRLVQPSTGLDLTERMAAWTERFARLAGEIDGAVLKARSPSCGVADTKLFPDPDAAEPLATGPGAFARVVLARLPHAAIEDELRLKDAAVRHRFLTRLWAMARLRAAAAAGAAGLAGFHALHEPLLRNAPADARRTLDGIVAELERSEERAAGAAAGAGAGGFVARVERYRAALGAALASDPEGGCEVYPAALRPPT